MNTLETYGENVKKSKQHKLEYCRALSVMTFIELFPLKRSPYIHKVFFAFLDNTSGSHA